MHCAWNTWDMEAPVCHKVLGLVCTRQTHHSLPSLPEKLLAVYKGAVEIFLKYGYDIYKVMNNPMINVFYCLH